jgi:hypothetical protein
VKTRLNNISATEDTIRKLKQSIILTDEQWEEFLENFDLVYPGLVERLRDKYPLLGNADLRYITLFLLRRSNREMSRMLGITIGAIRTVKYRLKKKLGFNSDEELVALLGKT